MIADASVDIARFRANIRRISRPQNNNGVWTPIFVVDPAIKHGCIAEQSRFIFRQQRVCRYICVLVQQHVAHMDLTNVSRTSRHIPRKWNVQTGKLNCLYNSRHRLEYRHVFGDVKAMKRRCYGDIHRWIGDVHGASANKPLIFGNSLAIDQGLPPSIGNHRRTFDLWKYRIFAEHRRILPNVTLTFTNASPNYRRAPPIIRLGTFMCDCKLTSCQYREQSRQIATFFIGRRRRR